MSEELETKQLGVVIDSIASGGRYRLVATREGVALKDGAASYSMDEYVDVMQNLWKNYLNKNVPPSLVGFHISDSSLVYETLHCISPNIFSCPDAGALPGNREQFLHWLLSEKNRIAEKISDGALESLVLNLNAILNRNAQRKLNQ
jgi:hypothetical protein